MKTHLELTQEYEEKSKTLLKDLKKAEKDYYDAEFRKHKNDMKQTWKLINNVINRRKNKVTMITKMKSENGQIVTNQEQICNTLNKHFTTNGPNLAKNLPILKGVSPKDYLPNKTSISLFMFPTSKDEIENLIDKLKLGKACGPDGINASFIKHGKTAISEILTKLINECINVGFFPDCLKRALVVPIHKKDDKDIPNNYRPISLLPCISKLFEKVIYKRIVDFCKSQKIISEKQFGFRNKHSTQNALTHLTDLIAEKMDNSETSIVVFLDLAKAFETVNHKILLEKLEHYGIRGIPLELMKSYLSGRKQSVKCGNHFSVYMDIECGVPQGSILGPLLFLLYVNDLPNIIDLSGILFADDTCVLSSSKSISIVINDTNEKLKRLDKWFITNKLTVNYTKTNYMVFSGMRASVFNGTIRMGSCILSKVSSTKYLGLMIDDQLNWKAHVSYLRSKISSCSNIMYKLRYLVPLESCVSVYYSLFYSKTSYGIMSWGHAHHDVVNPIRIMQNKIVKTILFQPICTRIRPLFATLNLLNVNDIFKLEISKHVHKFLSNALPDVFINQYCLITNTRTVQTRAAGRNDIIMKRTKKDIGKRTSTVLGATIWNGIPQNIRTLSFHAFRKTYKTFLIENYS